MKYLCNGGSSLSIICGWPPYVMMLHWAFSRLRMRGGLFVRCSVRQLLGIPTAITTLPLELPYMVMQDIYPADLQPNYSTAYIIITTSAQINTRCYQACVNVLQPPRQPSRGLMESRVGWGSLSWRVVNMTTTSGENLRVMCCEAPPTNCYYILARGARIVELA